MFKLYQQITKEHRLYLGTLTCLLLTNLFMPSAFAWQSEDRSLEINGFIEDETRLRNSRGLTKNRNTAQVELSKVFSRKFSFHSTFRASYDGVYQLNSTEFGDDAGGAILLENSATGTFVAHGAGPVTLDGGFSLADNPNEGLEVLGQHLHGPGGGVTFGVPVRPCDVDSRGCIDGYLDFDKQELASPEFNDRWDFLREAYFDMNLPLKNGRQLDIRLGRQQVVWGRTDLFRVLDVINPVDFSRNNIYDELEDIRIPMGILNMEYRMGGVGAFEDMNVGLMWNFEKFRPNKLGQGGSPNAILDAGNFFRGMKNCWDNGCTVSNFAGGTQATNFPKNTIGIRQANLPSWKLQNTQVGGKIEGVYKGVGFSLNTLYYYSQLPTLRGGINANDPFVAGVDSQVNPFLIAFDIDFPRVFLVGGSTDFYVDPIKTAFRAEMAITSGEEFANTARSRLFSESKVIRYVVGADRNTWIPWLNKSKAILFSGQVFGQHILDHESFDGALGKVGMPDWKDNWIATLLVKSWYKNDLISPQVITAYDVRAQSAVIEPSIDWLISDNWRFRIGANLKYGTGARKFDDNRSAAPFPALGGPAASTGRSGFEPLGRFRQGPIGTAANEDAIFANLRFRF